MRALLGAAIAVLLFAGCGDELDEFRDDLRPLEDRAAEQRAQISVELRSLTLGSSRDARELRAGTAELDRTYREIAQLTPPDDYEEPFAVYVRANDGTIRELERLVENVEASDARGVRDAGHAVVQHLGQSQSARLRWLE